MPISMTSGYTKIPHFGRFATVLGPEGQALPAQAEVIGTSGSIPPTGEPMPPVLEVIPPPTNLSVWAQRAVVYGGVPLCGYALLKKRGLFGVLAGLLGVGIAAAYFTGGFQSVGPPTD
jgi:hypothetical protein